MLIVISPAKTIDFDCPVHFNLSSIPDFIPEAATLVEKLRNLSPGKLAKLMDISENLANLNFERFAKWQENHQEGNLRHALLAFQGEVYLGMGARSFSEDDLQFAQKHLRVLSGLYGVLRPMDMIQAYRLEMGTALKVGRKKDLYAFWGGKIAEKLNEELENQGDDVLINLASEEYFHAVDLKRMKGRIIKPVFLDLKNGKYKMVSFWAKRARGKMAAYILQNRLQNPEEIKSYDGDGYLFDPGMSDDHSWVFKRDSPPAA